MISGKRMADPEKLIQRLEEDSVCLIGDRRFVNTYLGRWLFSHCENEHAPSSAEMLKMAKSIVFAFPSTAYTVGNRPWVCFTNSALLIV